MTRPSMGDSESWLWLPASFCFCAGIAGILGLGDFWRPPLLGMLILAIPHLAGLVLTMWAGNITPYAGMTSLVGSGLMAGLSWCEKLTRQTEGFEFQFNNELAGMMCCGANYFVLMIATMVVVPMVIPSDLSSCETTSANGNTAATGPRGQEGRQQE